MTMRVMVTGHDGYIGTTLVPMLQAEGHHVVGLDNMLFETCTFGPRKAKVDTEIRLDVRDVEPVHLQGVDAVIHLAGLSNDPSGDLNPDATYEINHRATTRLAEAAKEAGVRRFLFSSSCSIYGAHGNDYLDESAEFNPVTPYGESKILSERDLHDLADDNFTPTYLRNATAYGVSERMRGDLVVNNLTGFAVATNKVFLKSDGSSWRPLVHIADISRAFIGLMGAPLEDVHDEPFNIGATDENYLIRDVAQIVAEEVGCPITLSDAAFDDPRNYRVNCDKFAKLLPDHVPQWTVRKGVQSLRDAMVEHDLDINDLEGTQLMRVRFLSSKIESGDVTDALRWAEQIPVAP